MQRPFASGSRQAPDPYDQYLEQKGFYRKHTARDSSCLFRTISEQLYDTQLHHLAIRQRCVDYMRKYKNLFNESVDKDIDEYLDEMSKPKTFGTHLELRAIAYIYRRNIILFEAYDTGSPLVEEKYFTQVFRVFFTPEKHFDSVFTSNVIEIAAFCQAISYEILYKYVFNLPDVTYAVEQMLHSSSMEFIASDVQYCGPYVKRMTLEDGRQFDLSRPEDTHCILENHILCHFHNPNFPQFADNLHHDMHLVEANQYETQKVTKTLDSLLPEKYVSCVRQLLKEGITPFPYKVAKALDPDIYRNIEFDAWSELRKEQRFKNWYTGGNNLQVGVKCLVKLGGSQHNLFNCHIQEMSPEKGPCQVYIEELAQKRMVSYESLQPLPSDLAKPWPLPFRYQRHIERHPSRDVVLPRKITRHSNGNKRRYRALSPPSYKFISTIKKEIYSEDEISVTKGDVAYLKEFTSIQHYYPSSYEIMAMPLTVDHALNLNENIRNSRRNSSNSNISHAPTTAVAENSGKSDLKKDEESDLECVPSNEQYPYAYGGYADPYCQFPYDSSAHGPYYCMQPFPASTNNVMHGIYVQPTLHSSQQGTNPFLPVPQQYYGTLPTSGSSSVGTTTSNTVTVTNFCRRSGPTPATDRVNFLAANHSLLSSGSDLPKDIPTLRYFYNLGVDYYYKQLQNNPELNSDENKIDGVKKLTSDFQGNLKLDGNNYSSQTKADQNNNTANGNGNQHHNSKRFPPRYFNRRGEKTNYRGGSPNNGNNHHRGAGNADGGYGKTNNNNKHNYTNPNLSFNNNKVSTNNSMNNSSTEQAIQTSPISMMQCPEPWSEMIPITQPILSGPAPPVQFGPQYLPYYGENEQQANIFVQQPTVMTVPYGMYPGPPPPLGSGFQTYLPPPTGPITPSFAPNQQFLAPTSSNESAAAINSDVVESAPYTIMAYSPVYYSPASGNNGITASGVPLPTGFWYPPAPAPSSIAMSASVANATNTSGNFPNGTVSATTNNASR